MNGDQLRLHIKILEDGSLNFDEKIKMLNEVRKIIPPDQNRWNFRYAILPLVFVALTTPVYAFFSLCCENPKVDIPAELLSLSSTALGAIAAFLTSYKGKSDTNNE